MPNLLEQGAAWLDQQRHAHATTTVTYRRGDHHVEVPATVGQTVFRLDQGEAGITRVVTRDYLVREADLVLNDVPTLPERGDTIDELIDGVIVTHEVHAPNGEPEWRFSDPYRNVLRIHTLQLEETTP